MMSDVCKHCVKAGLYQVCPTGAIIRTEFDTVVIQSDVCNGCRACIAGCPLASIDMNMISGTAQKCTLCYDRMGVGLEPACSKACPTDSIQFGPISELRARAQKRVDQLKAHGRNARPALRRRSERPAGRPERVLSAGGQPEVYGLPANPQLPSSRLQKSGAFSVATAAGARRARVGRNPETADG